MIPACTVMQRQPRELQQMLELARQLRIAEIRLIPLADAGRGRSLPPVQREDYAEVGELKYVLKIGPFRLSHR